MMVKKITPFIVVAVISAVIGGGIILGYGSQFFAKTAQQNAGDLNQMLQPSVAQAQVSDARNTPIVKAAQAVGPAVVGITNKTYARDLYNRKVLMDKGSGSGVIFDSKGYIATNYHVVQNAQEILVSLADGRVFGGQLLGVDPVTDLAVVKIDAPNLPVAVLGNSDTLLVGEPAIAIGNPLGLEFKGSVTAGVISALNRSLEIGERKFKLIQTDAAINPGNSGGALVNADGVVVGINSAKISIAGVEGIGFSIPINSARPILQSIIEKGRVVRPYLGVAIIDRHNAPALGYQFNLPKGVYLQGLVENAAAAKAGLLAGDIILKVAGVEVNSIADLRSAVDTQAIGSTIAVQILRGGNSQTINVLLEEMPGQQ